MGTIQELARSPYWFTTITSPTTAARAAATGASSTQRTGAGCSSAGMGGGERR